MAVGLQEWDIVRLSEVLAEFVDVYGLEVALNIGVAEFILRDEALYALLLVERHDGAIHPALILIHKREVGIWLLDNASQHAWLEDEVRLQE